MAYLVALEIHRVHIVGSGALAGRGRAAFAGVRCLEDSVGGDVVARRIGREGFQVVTAIGHHFHHALHPVGVLRERFDVSQRFGLVGKEAFGAQYALQASQPFPASQASKNFIATSAFEAIVCLPWIYEPPSRVSGR
jgi:hypothetical protein